MSDLIYRAARFADCHHRDQKRKYTKRPYISHPARCAGRVMLLRHATDADVAIAWLHDTIEDCKVTYDELVTEFGKVVADGVLELTNPSKEHPELKRSARKLMDLEHARKMSVGSKEKKMIDRTDNLYDIIYDISFAELYLGESQQLFAAIKDVNQELALEFQDAMKYVKNCIKAAKKNTYE